jgi:small nuclear ribonucleoprotein (snRNP)-like protein
MRPRLIAELKRNDTVYAGVIGNVAGSENLVLKAVEELVRKPAWPK